ncbi:hypothetical protein GJU40_05590 [Bacillus lacus]|uniref:Uncharacterized protein n=1 Tax=Metabacillus lacus TaxID=1983721 RepID=A0A7X2LXT9_9BACI|nr:hypothetical protein [Metabacillus lacus]MRX71646.1 hypothetical protein [Metabacillus lacus]
MMPQKEEIVYFIKELCLLQKEYKLCRQHSLKEAIQKDIQLLKNAIAESMAMHTN